MQSHPDDERCPAGSKTLSGQFITAERPRVVQGWTKAHSSAAILTAAVLLGSGVAMAGVGPETTTGVPVLPVPMFEETGLPAFSMPVGATALDASTATGGAASTDSGTSTFDGGTSTSGSGATGTGSSGDGAGSTSMTSMMSRSWGDAASQNAQTVGITPVALAATCQIEASGCQTNPASASTTITGTFQMLDSTYTSMINAAVAANPSLAANIVPGLAGKLDPATESIAAAEYLKQGAVSLQNNGISNPSVLDVRGYYNFGPSAGAAIAKASPDQLISDLVPLTASGYKSNGIVPGVTTVGAWQSSVTNKIGASAASASVLLSKS